MKKIVCGLLLVVALCPVLVSAQRVTIGPNGEIFIHTPGATFGPQGQVYIHTPPPLSGLTGKSGFIWNEKLSTSLQGNRFPAALPAALFSSY